MSVETASNVHRFLSSNAIDILQIMGGEFFCNPNWQSVIDHIVDGVATARLVTNGDWAGQASLRDEVIRFLKSHPNIRVGVSYDKWHTNTFVDEAIACLEEAGVPCRRGDDVDNGEDFLNYPIVPVGRSQFEYCLYSTFSCYCNRPDSRYSFLIDEEGKIFKCAFGSWDYASVDDYMDGGFANCFREFNEKFYGAFVPNCKSCMNVYHRSCHRE